MSTARLFNGTSDYLNNSTTYLNASGGPFTMMCWVKSANLAQTNKRIFCCGDLGGQSHQWAMLYGFVNDGAGHARVELYTTGAGAFRTGSQITILDTAWHHVCYRYLGAGSEWAYFLDGVKTVINAALTGSLDGSLAGFVVGANASAVVDSFVNASLAEVALWSTNLSDANIAAIANANGVTLPSSLPTNLLGYWPLGLGSPDTDLSSANHPLTVNGTAIVTGPYAVAPTIGLPSSHTVPILTVQQW